MIESVLYILALINVDSRMVLFNYVESVSHERGTGGVEGKKRRIAKTRRNNMTLLPCPLFSVMLKVQGYQRIRGFPLPSQPPVE